jgi:hypothetical protein
LVMGRTYDGKVLDMFELGIAGYLELNLSDVEVSHDIKPVLLF